MKIATAWNAQQADAIAAGKERVIKGLTYKTKRAIAADISSRMHAQCGHNEACWLDKVPAVKTTTTVTRYVRPKQPDEWRKRPNAWLSNWDIQKVMRQYEEKRSLHYKFLGCVSIDFEDVCTSYDLCNLMDTLPKLIAKGVQYLGLITNLDKHDEPGSHWTSLFICIDPSKPCFGAYYYDSVMRPPPPEIQRFVQRVRSGMASPEKFKIDYSKIRHQNGNNECGMFSLVYQIRWLKMLEKNPNTVLNDVIKYKLTDEEMNKIYRNRIFIKPIKQV